jgi:pyruvate dehydrogenase E1 component alpha subunit
MTRQAAPPIAGQPSAPIPAAPGPVGSAAAGGATPASVSDRDLHRRLLRVMLLQRRFEERCAEAYALGKIGGFCHLYIGQEATGTGAISVLRDDDYVIGTYRDHAQALARGITPRAVMAELFGKTAGCSHGKGGSMHLFSQERRFLGGHGIVAANIPIATGVGFAIKYRGGDQVCLCFFGEAAVNGGAFHEALNMAGLWRLPVVYVVENNLYGMGTAFERAAAVTEIADRGRHYDVGHASVDGQDVLAVRAVVGEAVARARAERRPALIESHTFRYMGHSMSDAASGTYRPKAELEENLVRDPITILRARMQQLGDLTDDDFARLDTEIKAICEDAWQFADQSPEPPLEALMQDVTVPAASIDGGGAAVPSGRAPGDGSGPPSTT